MSTPLGCRYVIAIEGGLQPHSSSAAPAKLSLTLCLPL
jgi:hypothetical protein